jgi:isopentenyl-diphosphate delta-isomerase
MPPERAEPRAADSALDEYLVLVDESDRVVGYERKSAVHDGAGILHRAFSIFVFDDHRQVLLQKRSRHKRLWPLFWSNTCCGHPRRGETDELATVRRLREEMGIETPLQRVFQVRYRFAFEDRGSEHELCSVHLGRFTGSVSADPAEIEEWKLVAIDELTRELADHPDRYTPWLRLEWGLLAGEHRAALESVLGAPDS